jgi:formate hydrogenlyase subunit 3/multisubunit Na+/H+ antiporter MnhD subunit
VNPEEPGAIWAVLLIVSPLATAIIAVLARRVAVFVAYVNAALTTAAAFGLLNAVADRPLTYALGDWGAPLGIDLYADSLTAVLLVATSVIILSITLYAPDYLARTRTGTSFWPLTFFLHAALNGLYLSADVFNLYVALELLSLSAVALVALGDRMAAVAAALRYLLASLVASLAYLLGVALLYHTYGALDLTVLAAASRGGATPWAALGLMTAGLAIKGALFPVHFWLPAAHAEAPAPVSALLSGLVVKAPFYVLVRLWFGPFQDAPQAVGEILGLLGSAAILWGSLQALRQVRLKPLVAYSTVAQIGYLFLFFPLARAAGVLNAVTVFILAHGLAKVAMFLAAGNILFCLGHDRIQELDRIGRRLPLSLAAFGIAGVCIMGLPPSGNFIAKWLLIEAAFESGAWGWAVVIIAGSLMAAAYVFRVVGHAFTPEHGFEGGAQITTSMAWVPFLVSLLALLLGLIAAPLLEVVDMPALAANAAAVHAP